MNDFKYQNLHFVNSPSTNQTYMAMVQTKIFMEFLKTNFYFVEWDCHWYNVCQWHPCYIITYRCTLFCWIASLYLRYSLIIWKINYAGISHAYISFLSDSYWIINHLPNSQNVLQSTLFQETIHSPVKKCSHFIQYLCVDYLVDM